MLGTIPRPMRIIRCLSGLVHTCTKCCNFLADPWHLEHSVAQTRELQCTMVVIARGCTRGCTEVGHEVGHDMQAQVASTPMTHGMNASLYQVLRM